MKARDTGLTRHDDMLVDGAGIIVARLTANGWRWFTDTEYYWKHFMKARDNQFYGKGVFEDIIKPKILDNQIIGIGDAIDKFNSDYSRQVSKRIPITIWSEVNGISLTIARLVGGAICNQGGYTYLVTLINKEQSNV